MKLPFLDYTPAANQLATSRQQSKIYNLHPFQRKRLKNTIEKSNSFQLKLDRSLIIIYDLDITTA